jgi:hypothetical protein
MNYIIRMVESDFSGDGIETSDRKIEKVKELNSTGNNRSTISFCFLLS